MSNETEKQQYIDSNNALMGASWDAIELPPEFATFPNGLYAMKIEAITHDAEEGVIAARFSLLDVLDVPDSDIPVPAANSLLYVRYSLARKGNALGDFRRAFESIGASIGAANPQEFIEQAGGLEIIVEVTARRDKQDATRVYNNVRHCYTLEEYEAMVNAQNSTDV